MTPNLQPLLENDLVLLRPLRQSDFDALYSVAKDPKIWAMHQASNRWELETFQVFFQGALDSGTALTIVDKVKDVVIGSTRFKISEASDKALEIGWTFLSRNYWGGTYNKSVKSLMIAHGFEYFDYILFHIDENNHRSQKAIQKLGGLPIDKEGTLGYLHHNRETAKTFYLAKRKTNRTNGISRALL